MCVGDLQFSEAVVGSARDVLRECIDSELDKLAKGYGLEVRNVVVPNIMPGRYGAEEAGRHNECQVCHARGAAERAEGEGRGGA